MRLESHILKAIEANDRGSVDEALMHATIAIDATARKLFNKTGKRAYKDCIRKYYWIIERFIGEGLNIEETKWTHLQLDDGHGKSIINPDFADIIYHVFRCSHAHGDEIPIKFELIPSFDGYFQWNIEIVNNGVRMPDTVVWALLAVSVFAKINSDIKTYGDHWISWGSKVIGTTTFVIKDYWGKEDELKNFFSPRPALRVKLAL